MPPTESIQCGGMTAGRRLIAWRYWITAAGMLLIGLAGLSKAYWAEDFATSLASWIIIPNWARVPVALLVPCGEWAVFCWFFFGRQQRLAALSALGFVLAFTLAILAESSAGGAPSCNCFGLLLEADMSADALPWMLVRNCGIMICLLAGWRLRS